jgi:hypothetical protein
MYGAFIPNAFKFISNVNILHHRSKIRVIPSIVKQPTKYKTGDKLSNLIRY